MLRWIRDLSLAPRPAGTSGDSRALRYMRGILESTGRFTVEEGPFRFQRYAPQGWSLRVDGEEAECTFALCSASTPRGGVQGRLCRSGQEGLEGKVVILRLGGVHESIAVEEAAKRGALAAIAYQERGPMLVGRVAYPLSSIPCVTVSGKTGRSLWLKASGRGPRIEMKVRARTVDAQGTNLYAVPRKETVRTVFTAHRDSRPLSPGAVDNASGSSLLLFMAGVSVSPGFGLLSTDAEEYGLRGARAFVEAERVDREIDVVNLDSIGSGPLHLVERSRGGPLSRTLNAKLDQAAAHIGVRLPRMTTPRGSDSDVFREAGHRASWIRSFPTPTATTLEDKAVHVRGRLLDQCARILRRFVSTGS